MKPAKLVLIGAMVIGSSLAIVAQLPQENRPQPEKPQSDPDFNQAHQGLFTTDDKVKEATDLTKRVAAGLPNTVSSGPVPHKNFIDDFVFARMERNQIPHAPLSTDEEFLRRAYLDATGFLPTPIRSARSSATWIRISATS